MTAAVGTRTAAELLADAETLQVTVRAYGAWLGTDRLPIAAALALKAYAWAVVEEPVTQWLEHRRVPDHSAANTAATGGAGGYRVEQVEERWTVLPGDPLAGTPTATVVPNEGALLAALGATLVDGHLAPAVQAFQRLRGGGARPLWGSAVPVLVYPATVAHTHVVSDRFDAVEQLLSLLPSEIAALVETVELNDGTGWRPMMLRRTCCYAYALAEPRLCTTCCLLDDRGRDQATADRGACWRRRLS